MQILVNLIHAVFLLLFGSFMSHQIPWNKFILETFIEEALLTKDEEMVLRTRIAGWSRTKQSMELGMSLSTIDRHIANVRAKYDNAARYNPLLPPRKKSKAETWMDNH